MLFSCFNHIKTSLLYRVFDPQSMVWFRWIYAQFMPILLFEVDFFCLLKNCYKSIFNVYLGSFGSQIRYLHKKLHILIWSNHIFMNFLKNRPPGGPGGCPWDPGPQRTHGPQGPRGPKAWASGDPGLKDPGVPRPGPQGTHGPQGPGAHGTHSN